MKDLKITLAGFFLFVAIFFVMCTNEDGLFKSDDTTGAVSIETYICDTTGITDSTKVADLTGYLFKVDTVKVGEVITIATFVSGNTSGLSFNWNLGDGAVNDTSYILTHSYATAGTYLAIFTFSNNIGYSLADTVTIIAEDIQGAGISGFAFYEGKQNHDSISVLFHSSTTDFGPLYTNSNGAIEYLENFPSGTYDIYFSPKAQNAFYPKDTILSVVISNGVLTSLDTILLKDSYSPHISLVKPNGELVERTTVISGNLSDTCSGIKPSSFTLMVNGSLAADSLVTVNSNSFSYNTGRLPDNTYNVLATISDSAGNVDTASWNFTIDATVLTIMGDTLIKINTPINMNALAGNLFNELYEYRWDFDGDSTWDDTTFSTDSVISKIHTFTSSGIFNSILYIKDDTGIEKYSAVEIQVNNNNPIILTSTPDTLVSINDTIKFYVTAIDSDGVISKCEWDLNGDGVYELIADSLFNPSKAYSLADTLNVLLRLSDNDNKTVTKSINVEIIQDVPVPDAGIDTSIIQNIPITLTGSAEQEFGTIVMYKWDFNGDGVYDDSSSTDPALGYTYLDTGSYIAKFYVRDDDGNDSTDTRVVTVTSSNSAPVVTAQDDDSVDLNDSIVLTVTVVDDGDIAKFYWTGAVIDSTDSGSIKVAFNSVGAKTIYVQAEDDEGLFSNIDSIIVNVTSEAPVVIAQNDTSININDSIVLRASATDNGDIVKYYWFGAVSDTTDSGNVKVAFDSAGSDTVFIQVLDNDGLMSVVDTIVVTVTLDAPIITPVLDTMLSESLNCQITLTASDTNGTGSIRKYYWDTNSDGVWDDSTDIDNKTFTINDASDGIVDIIWQVKDDDGEVSPLDTFNIWFNRAPIGIIMYTPVDSVDWYAYDIETSKGQIKFVYKVIDPDSLLGETHNFKLEMVTASTALYNTYYTGFDTSCIVSSMHPNDYGFNWRLNVTDIAGNSYVGNGNFEMKPSPIFDGMRLIPAKDSSFSMGDNSGGSLEKPQHSVRFTYNFWMDTTEVTQLDYHSLMGETYLGYIMPNWVDEKGKADYCPAYRINWYDALLYCNARSRKEGLDTIYRYTNINGVPGNNCTLENVTIDRSKIGYRLPTDAEWEYACRAGTISTYYWGSNDINDYAWFDGNTGFARTVATKLPNSFGLYDMSGNVGEWLCGYAYSYTPDEKIDPNKLIFSEKRIVRGGYYGFQDYMLTSYSRLEELPENRADIGIRVILNEEIPESW